MKVSMQHLDDLETSSRIMSTEYHKWLRRWSHPWLHYHAQTLRPCLGTHCHRQVQTCDARTSRPFHAWIHRRYYHLNWWLAQMTQISLLWYKVVGVKFWFLHSFTSSQGARRREWRRWKPFLKTNQYPKVLIRIDQITQTFEKVKKTTNHTYNVVII